MKHQSKRIEFLLQVGQYGSNIKISKQNRKQDSSLNRWAMVRVLHS